MHVVERTKALMMSTGSEWILWLLLALSAASIAVILERVYVLRSLGGDLAPLRAALRRGLREGGFARARALLSGQKHPAARIALRGLEEGESESTPEGLADAMAAEAAAVKRELEQRFAFLATLGANAPFIGLFGTVVGILQAFDALGQGASGGPGALAPQAVMSSISEALVATAIGLGVAIPAVFAFNMFERRVKSALEDGDILSLEILAHRKGVGGAEPDFEPRRAAQSDAPELRPSTAVALLT